MLMMWFAVKHEADIMAETVYAIAKQQRVWKRSFARELVGTVKEVLGTCHSLGITVDGSCPEGPVVIVIVSFMPKPRPS
jgi:hypothetical protein